MRTVATSIFLLVSGVAYAADGLDPALGFIFPASEAQDLLNKCSRRVPINVTSFWTPTESDIQKLEKLFPEAFTREVERSSPSRQDLIRAMATYARQYGGIIVDQRKLVHVNGFPSQFMGINGIIKEPLDRMRDKPLLMCDGGPGYFGAVFDPASDRFVSFQFNGSGPPPPPPPK